MGGRSGGGGRAGRSGASSVAGGDIGETPPPITVTEAKQLAEEIPAKPISPGFTPAPTMEVAINRAKRMGVNLISKGKAPNELAIANDVNNWIKDRKSKGYAVPKSIIIDKSYRDAYAEANAKFNEIKINPKTWNKAKTVTHLETTTILDHEMGHMLHKQSSPAIYEKLGKYYKTPANAVPLTVKKHVSKYGGTDKLEFVAEVYSGKVAGKTYPPAVERLYKELGGPKV